MIIKKESERITYFQKTTTFVLKIGNKEVSVYEHIVDSEYGDNECDVEVDETDREELTDEESELLDDYLDEVLKLKDGETFDTKK